MQRGRNLHGLVGLAVLTTMLLLAGCSGGSPTTPGSNSPTPTGTVVDATTSTEIPSPTDVTTPTLTQTPVPTHPDNPYGTETLTVAVVDESSTGYNRSVELQNTFRFWEHHAVEHAGYPIQYERDDNASNPDVILKFVDEIRYCGLDGGSGKTLGCAPIVDKPPRDSVQLRVVNRYNQATTERILKHEFGHTLGLNHSSSPEIMREKTTTAPQAVEVPYAVDIDRSAYQPTKVKNQIAGGIEFIESGGNGSIVSEVTFREVDDHANAAIYFDITSDRNACDGQALCVEDNTECYLDERCSLPESAGFEVTTANIKHEYVAFVFAYESYYILYLEGAADERPVELDPDETDHSRTWWE